MQEFIGIEQTPFASLPSNFPVLSPEEARAYSIHSEAEPAVFNREYTQYTGSKRTRNVYRAAEQDVQLDILHLKNAYIVRHLGVCTAEGVFLGPEYVGRFSPHYARHDENASLLFPSPQTALPTFQNVGPIPVIEQECYYAGLNQFGYGHTLIEATPRLWGLERLKQPMLIAVSEQQEIVSACTEALFPGQHRVFTFEDITLVRDLYVASQPVKLGSYCGGKALSMPGRVGEYYLSRRDHTDFPRKLYVTRAGWKRALRNEEVFTKVLRKQGFHLCAPERLPLRD